MAEEKRPLESEPQAAPEASTPDVPGAPAPDLSGDISQPVHDGPAQPDPGDVVISFEKIDELLKERRDAAREKVEQESPPEPSAEGGKEEKTKPEPEQPKPRRGRLPKEKAVSEDKDTKAATPRRGRPPKADKAAPDKATPPKPRDKVSRSGSEKATADKGGSISAAAPAQEQAPAAPTPPPRPVEEGKVIYLKLYTFRDHPFKVEDNAAMTDLVSTIKEHGVMTPATVRPEKDGSGYEIVAGHRRHRGSELAGLDELPCIVRDMTDIEAVREMKNSNKQRGDPLPSELAKLLDLEVEAIKHQGGRLDNVAPGDIGKRSVEIVGENNGMNYKKVMRYIRLNSLVPELLNKVDDKKLGFMPAVEISYIKPKNQRLIAVSIDGEQSSPSHAQAKRLRKLDQAGKLNGDIIDGILSEKKKEDRGVIISTAELEKYFGKEVTPAKMKEQIISLLDDWKAKQPPELGKPEKKADLEK
ncbi:ParB/RepB/Spo0J family partition protein [Agathobaculum hominis]|uniref:ParB/RepB/Spo0J family partition protein n=1 Tax=Agathobaculum hominis TaxID=2763014 RepID=A0ABR7GPP6_9FIRM|nr:ParB/RepB/Spo0J family partition protein [Agathobaculum hominis]MBC5696272.1 ParB/RepB/Spo0J family partition protein [Agathobaculum hominis]